MSVSAVVLNYNGGDLVIKCLNALVAQHPPLDEILCVDNGSRDGSDAEIEARFTQVRLLRLGTNTGFAGGMNRGIHATSSDFVVLLNLDVEVEADYVALCVDALNGDHTLGGVTGKLLRNGDRVPPILDTTGHLVYRNRRAVDRGEGEPDAGQYDGDRELFSVCGAAPCYRRAMLDDVALDDGEVFDEDFFMYFEDFDLSWRGQLRGWHFAFAPLAIGRHARGGSGGKAETAILACNHRNRLLVMLHNDAAPSFLRHLPGIAYTEVRASLHMLAVRPAALVLAWLQFLRMAPRHWRIRRAIQRRRTVRWRELEPAFHAYEYGVGPTVRRRRERAALRAVR